jgi:hypothetical protein
MQDVRLRGNEAREGRNKIPPLDSIQYEPLKQDKEKIMKIKKIIHNAKADTLFEELPTTSEIEVLNALRVLNKSVLSAEAC